MRVPAFMLRQTATVTPYLGSSPYEDVYGDPYTLKCRLEPRHELVVDRDGSEVVAAARMFCFPEASISLVDTVAYKGRVYDVITVDHMPGPSGRTHHIEVALR